MKKKTYPPKNRNLKVKFSLLIAMFVTATVYANYQGAVLGTNYLSKMCAWFGSVTIDGIIATIFAITMALISAHFYNHKGRKYAADKTEPIPTPTSFSYVYRYIQVTTILASIGSFLTDAPVFLVFHNSIFWLYFGIAISTMAIILFVTAKLNLGNHYSPCFDSLVPTDIIQDGLYRHVRHPIYTSNILLLIGMIIASGSMWIVLNLVLLTVYYVLSAYKEEEVLKARFPVYQDYIKNSNMFVPFPKFNRKHA